MIKNFEKRINQHFNGYGSKVTQKFKPLSAKIIDCDLKYFAKTIEQYYTDKHIQKFGYNNVRGFCVQIQKYYHKLFLFINHLLNKKLTKLSYCSLF